MTAEEIERDMSVILAAYGEKFPQLRGKAVRPDLGDDNRKAFARLLVEKLDQCNVVFFKKKVDTHNFMLNSGCFPSHK